MLYLPDDGGAWAERVSGRQAEVSKKKSVNYTHTHVKLTPRC